MVAEHGEGPLPKGCGELGIAAGRGIDVLTANDPWAKEVENTNGQDRNVTTNEMDEGLESTEKVEKTSCRRACLAFARRWTSCWRHCAGGSW